MKRLNHWFDIHSLTQLSNSNQYFFLPLNFRIVTATIRCRRRNIVHILIPGSVVKNDHHWIVLLQTGYISICVFVWDPTWVGFRSATETGIVGWVRLSSGPLCVKCKISGDFKEAKLIVHGDSSRGTTVLTFVSIVRFRIYVRWFIT